MKTYIKSEPKKIEAIQYNGQGHELVKKMRYDYAGNIMKAMDWPDGFNAVETYSGWKKIHKTDWIVQKNNKILVISDGVFQLLYEVDEDN